jgi:hypothetical protein
MRFGPKLLRIRKTDVEAYEEAARGVSVKVPTEQPAVPIAADKQALMAANANRVARQLRARRVRPTTPT